MATEQHVTVGIIGGGIAGLTLANILEQAGISYVLWEAKSEIAPAEGASIGLMPNGLRILDQIGLLQDVEQYAVPHHSWEYRDSDGTLLNTLNAMSSYPDLLGYGAFFMERQRVLEILYGGVKDKSPIHMSKRVCSVEDLGAKSVVTAADGSQYSCDFVAGADGVRSIVRQHIQEALPHLQKTPQNFASKYACVYGMSDPLPEIGPGRAFTIHRANISSLIFSGMGGALYWFVFVDLKEAVELGKTKRYVEEDVEAVFSEMADVTITDDVTFSDMYRARRAAVMTPLEQGLVDTWFSGRMFLLGDAAHKMLPHTAMGAMQAMESAACFASLLLELRTHVGDSLESGVPSEDVEACLTAYAQKRHSRVAEVIQTGHFHCMTQLKIGPAADGWTRRLPALRNDMWLNIVLEGFCKAEKIEGWHRNSARVDYYTEQVQLMREKFEKRKQMMTMAPSGPHGGPSAQENRHQEPELVSAPA
ncbi:Monooxygenase FAD-binding protein [Macrophomina phaseolina MS6]|uniref:Monooxygenase FAD-binding protein n=1 Tax=Macrophomina phaseolina (strain MS6) TaxID=1126212 RepID=K2RUT3_MACPH|nr:Monooxygenase FAD-binding protein [Macrophomina phaseolina MS6]